MKSCFPRSYYRLFTLYLFLLFTFAPSSGITIQGYVQTTEMVVQNAQVTFINESDTLIKYITITDNNGYYQVVIPSSAISSHGKFKFQLELGQNYPNPFSATTIIPYSLHANSDVQICIYDLQGRRVRQIQIGTQAPGHYQVLYNAKNDAGQKITPGIYFYQLKTNKASRINKMIYLAGSTKEVLNSANAPHSLTKQNYIDAIVDTSLSFTIKIANTSLTTPLIQPTTFSNVQIKSDTTINLKVTALPVVNVYPDSLRQIIRGFGAANILPWRPDMTVDQIDKAFGIGPGKIGLSILRLRVPYDLTEYNLSQQVPTAKRAYQNYGVTIIASPWTPPPALKTNNNIVGGELKESCYADYANHLKTFVNYLATQGVPLYAISIQNEPDIKVTYESCDWNAAQMVKFIKEHARTIGTKIIAPESYQFRKEISDAILNDSAACANLDIVGGHIYGGGLEPYPLAEKMGKEIWMTEHLDTDTSWSAVLATGKEINDCMNVGMSAYIWWYIVRYYGPILENGQVSKRGYVMSQFARFIRPGAYRLKATYLPQRNVYCTAYKNSDGKICIVAININSTPISQTFKIHNPSVTSFTPYTTSKIKNCSQGSAITVDNGVFSFNLEASSITTFVSN